MAESKSKQDAAGAEDENKRKFREALDRKMSKSAGGAEHKDAGGKQSRAHGAAGNHREFRRKSG
jgi:hypothetical protein